MRSLRCQLATTRVVQPKPSLASVDHTWKTNPVTPPNYGEYMDSSAGRNVELSGPLAAERRVLLDAALRQAELAMNNCSGFSREDLADHSLALTSSVERASVVSARFAAVAEERLDRIKRSEGCLYVRGNKGGRTIPTFAIGSMLPELLA